MVAQSYLVEGKIDRAAQVAGEAVKRSGKSIPLAAWVAGQAAWRSNDFAKAMNMFGICVILVVIPMAGCRWRLLVSRAASRIGDDDAAEKMAGKSGAASAYLLWFCIAARIGSPFRFCAYAEGDGRHDVVIPFAPATVEQPGSRRQ